MARVRTAEIDLSAEAVDAALAAFHAAGINAALRPPRSYGATDSSPADAVLDVTVDDRVFPVLVEVVSYCTGQTATRMVRRLAAPKDTVPLLVADRITAEARTILTDAGWSWLDRRGQLHLRASGVRVDLAVPSAARATASTAGPTIAGRSGITIAYWLSAHPGDSLSPTVTLRFFVSLHRPSPPRCGASRARVWSTRREPPSPQNCSGSWPRCGAQSAPGCFVVLTRSNTCRLTLWRRLGG